MRGLGWRWLTDFLKFYYKKKSKSLFNIYIYSKLSSLLTPPNDPLSNESNEKNEKSYGYEKVRKTTSIYEETRNEGHDVLKLWNFIQ
jgi:hypothetical protein